MSPRATKMKKMKYQTSCPCLKFLPSVFLSNSKESTHQKVLLSLPVIQRKKKMMKKRT